MEKIEIVIVDIYDQSYFCFFANGKKIAQLDKDLRMSTFFKKWFRKELCQEVGVENEDQLCYTFIDLYANEDKVDDYCSEDYCYEYSAILEFCKNNNVKPLFEKVDLEYIEENY